MIVRLQPAGRELLTRVFPGHIALVRELFLDRLTRTQLAAIREGLSRVAAD